ncbi:glycosyltransferase family 2 protein [Aristophania vespae]|uniref:glycosyltransferase family 2 protein n=1 Tax=Aristophania vespae TaxID=2697033 RepID=UPI0023510A07|nr:glycosyltransferase family 2 protein [Aristophania vespae]UMM64781.1 hypothetical protein DM15PD_18010 [Aristophania vespae]
MSNNNKVAIVLRTKDRTIFLKRAINSIVNQTFKNYVAYVVNDGGNINDISEVKNNIPSPLKGNFSFINLPVSAGRGAALSIGISSGNEKYIHILDDDDTIEPEFLEKTVKFLEDDKEEIFSAVKTSNYDVLERVEDGKIIIEEKTDKYGFDNDGIKDYISYLMVRTPIVPNTLLFRRKCVIDNENAKTELNYSEDIDLFVKIMLWGEIGVIKEFLSTYHRRKPNNSPYDNCTNTTLFKYDQSIAWKNNVIRKAIRGDGLLTTTWAAALQRKAISDMHISRINSEINNLNDSFSSVTNLLKSILNQIEK